MLLVPWRSGDPTGAVSAAALRCVPLMANLLHCVPSTARQLPGLMLFHEHLYLSSSTHYTQVPWPTNYLMGAVSSALLGETASLVLFSQIVAACVLIWCKSHWKLGTHSVHDPHCTMNTAFSKDAPQPTSAHRWPHMYYFLCLLLAEPLFVVSSSQVNQTYVPLS